MSDDFNQTNPFGDQDPLNAANPYASPQTGGGFQPNLQEQVKTKVMLPAIFMLIVAGLAFVADCFGAVSSMIVEPQVDPNAPEVVQNFQRGMAGPSALIMQSLFAICSLVIIVGCVQMMRFKSWGLAMTVSILTMLNFGNCCCIFGLPFGIWAIVILNSQDVKAAFAQSK
jgi:hypothetical protein